MPLLLSASMIVGMGIATASTSTYNGLAQGQQTPPPTQKPPGQAKPVEPTKTAEPAAKVEVKKAPVVDPIPGITYADKSGVTYVVARTLAERLGMEVELDPTEKILKIGDREFTEFRRLYSGEVILPIRGIDKFGGTIDPTADESTVLVRSNGIEFNVVVGQKHIDVDKAAQELTAYQGDLVVIKTNVSTGRPGHNTPIGEFTTGPKERMHYSHKYNDAEMPYAVQVNGDVFFHGYGSVPRYPASHGCIRIPLGRKNPAKYLYTWVNRGVPVKIYGTYTWESHHSKRRKKKRH